MAEKRRFNKFKKFLTEKFHVVTQDPDTYEPISTFHINRLAISMYFLSIGLLFALLTWLLIWMTPLKFLMPGYGRLTDLTSYDKLQNEIGELEKAIIARDLYIKNLSDVISGNVTKASDIKEQTTAYTDSFVPVPLVDDDAELKEKMRSNPELYTSSAVLPGNGNIEEKSLELLYLIPPVKGIISSSYDADSEHFGTDVVAPLNTPIKAIMDGYIISSNWTLKTGNSLGIQHDHGLVSFYRHNSVLLKEIGDFVAAGEAIAIIGNTGEETDGPHLHFELWQNGLPLNAERYIQFE